jgi:hypothetical protein
MPTSRRNLLPPSSGQKGDCGKGAMDIGWGWQGDRSPEQTEGGKENFVHFPLYFFHALQPVLLKCWYLPYYGVASLMSCVCLCWINAEYCSWYVQRLEAENYSILYNFNQLFKGHMRFVSEFCNIIKLNVTFLCVSCGIFKMVSTVLIYSYCDRGQLSAHGKHVFSLKLHSNLLFFLKEDSFCVTFKCWACLARMAELYPVYCGNNVAPSSVNDVEHCIIIRQTVTKTKLNPVALVRERTLRTERPSLVGEVSANFCG